MKPKLETKKVLKQDSISAAVTTTCKLTIKGQIFDLSLEELEHIHNIIGQALGKKKDRPIVTDEYKKMIEEATKKHRDQFPPQIWPQQPYVPPRNFPSPRRPEGWPPEVWCSVENSVTRNADSLQPFVEACRSIDSRADELYRKHG